MKLLIFAVSCLLLSSNFAFSQDAGSSGCKSSEKAVWTADYMINYKPDTASTVRAGVLGKIHAKLVRPVTGTIDLIEAIFDHAPNAEDSQTFIKNAEAQPTVQLVEEDGSFNAASRCLSKED